MRTSFTTALLLCFCCGFASLDAKPVTFSEHIAPILFRNCTPCHRPGEAAPFSLLTYSDAVKRGPLLVGVTKSRFMPPWKAEPASYAYRDDRRLTDAQIEMIAAWVRQGMPEGKASKTPPLPEFPGGWRLGEPDLIVEMPAAFVVPAEGPDLYRNFVIPLNLPEDKFVQAIELRPSARRTVHHVLYFADTSGEARKMAPDQTGGMRFTRGTVPMGGWAVGAQPHRLPGGLGVRLPKGSDLMFQYHFHPTGKEESEKSTVGLYFTKKAPDRTVTAVMLPPVYSAFSGVKIPAGEKSFTVKDSFVLPVDVDAVSIGAHAHYIGKQMKMTATLPSGEVKTLLEIKDWDFSWQDRYFFEDFVALPKGTRLDGEVTWDNSSDNRLNPARPPVPVKWGEQSADEMGAVNLQVVPHNEADLPILQREYRQHLVGIVRARIIQEPGLLQELMSKFGGQLPLAPGLGRTREQK